MQNDNQPLLQQLNNLVMISDFVTIQKNFILGYFLKNLHVIMDQTIKETVRVSQLIEDAFISQLLTKNQFLEMIVVLGNIQSKGQNKKPQNFLDFYQETISSVLFNNQYLKNTYFYNSDFKIQNLQELNKEIIEQKETSELLRTKSNIAQCPVCFVDIKHHNVCILACGHIIHRQCFQACMKQSITNKKFPLKCPFEECKQFVETEDVQEYLPKQLIEKFYEFTLHNFVDKNAKNMSWCPTAGCSNAFQFDQNIKDFSCTKCHKIYCLDCKTQSHKGMSCQQNKRSLNLSEQDKQFVQFAKGAQYKQCPQCRFWVQKAKGCCHMTCRCSYEFCYVCGGRYGDCYCEQTYENYYGQGSDDYSGSSDSQSSLSDTYQRDMINHQHQDNQMDEEEII